MATTTAMNAWSEQLARSLIPDQTPPLELRKHLDHFSRSLKQHNYARTNQFEVLEKLNGLEEKFQVLNHEDISDALHERRVELTHHQLRWIPDVLDLLLHLSHHPLRYTRLERLGNHKQQSSVPASLKWSEVEADDPIDRRSRLWRQPSYSDQSSDEDGIQPSSTATSPISHKHTKTANETTAALKNPLNSIVMVADPTLVSSFDSGLFWKRKEEAVTITEAQAVREILFMAQGFPTALFKQANGEIVPSANFKLAHLSPRSLDGILRSAVEVSRAAQSLRNWAGPNFKVPFMQVLKDNLKGILTDYYNAVSDLHARHVSTVKRGGVVSLLETVEALQQSSRALVTAERYVKHVKGQDSIGHIDVLFDHLCRSEHSGDSVGSAALVNVFHQTLNSYTHSLQLWIHEGTIPESSNYFFVQRVPEQKDKARLWQSWYTCTESGQNRPLKFLQPFAERIFHCGKAVAFMKALSLSALLLKPNQDSNSIITSAISSNSSLNPFAATLSASLEEYINSQLQLSTANLQNLLQQTCDVSSTLTALSHLYLASSPLATDNVESKIFTHLDRCLRTWNDRFLVYDLLSETHTSPTLDINRVVVHSEATSASTLPSARRSVQILSNIAFDYLLPWPIANIILPETLASYRRVSLLLMQIRRAKYVLERRAYSRLRLSLSSSSPRSTLPSTALGLYTTLFAFVTTLYAHFTSCVISPLTQQLHSDASSTTTTRTIDELVALHQTYLRNMEWSCLTSKTLKVLKDGVVSMLDLSVEFAFSLNEATPGAAENRGVGNEGDAAEERVRFEEKTQKMQAQFKKQLDFLVAGLRGVARSSAATTFAGLPRHEGTASASEAVSGQGEMMALLADSLESALVLRRRR